ncbi:hypothetical protein L7F22_005003 [Adiantum nelumboides]|nr:hypothetical protein [Adiantum nelumboides]
MLLLVIMNVAFVPVGGDLHIGEPLFSISEMASHTLVITAVPTSPSEKLEILRQKGEEKIKEQEDRCRAVEQDLKNQVLESEKKILKMEKKQTNFLISFEKQAHITQEAYLRKAMDENNKKLQELCHDITQGLIEEKYLKQCFDKNFEKLKSDANAAEKEQKARIPQEIEKSKQLNKQLDNAQVQLEDFTNRATERLLGLSGKVQCLEIEVQTLRDFETNGLQKLENKYLDVTQRHEYFLQESPARLATAHEDVKRLRRGIASLQRMQERHLDSPWMEAQLQQARQELIIFEDCRHEDAFHWQSSQWTQVGDRVTA